MEDLMQFWYDSAYETARLYASIEAFSRRAMRVEPVAPAAGRPEKIPAGKMERHAANDRRSRHGILPAGK